VPIPLTNGPGVYIQELTNPVQPIVGVSTSVAAFYGQAPQGVVDYPFQVNSWGDYQNEFGNLDSEYPLSYAVYLFFLNGGTTALVVRYNDPGVSYAAAKLSDDITLWASSPGAWATALEAVVDTDPDNLINPPDPKQPDRPTKAGQPVNQFNLTIKQWNQAEGTILVSQEVYPGASLVKGTPQYLPTQLAASQLVTTNPPEGSSAPANGWTKQPAAGTVWFKPPAAPAPKAGGDDEKPAAAAPKALASGVPLPLGEQNLKSGIYALLKADIFNILCLPVAPATPYTSATLEDAAAFCQQQRAMLILDPPSAWPNVNLNFPTVRDSPALESPSANAVVYYPNLVLTDSTGASFTAGPCGAVAGVWAATDSSRGVWKAPAGTAATITGITGFTAQVSDGESGTLNPLAVNALRTMPAVGPVVWGARTTEGLDQNQNQWKYVPVRRLALYIEESLRRGTLWAVFEPNDEPLWSSLRLNVTTFMQGLFAQGAFEGTTPATAYVVQCDANNNPQSQIDLGIVNIGVGFAPLYPAEFVIINIQQLAGQA
jgi:uncharacterized protein